MAGVRLGRVVIIRRSAKCTHPLISHPTCVAGVILLMHERIGEKDSRLRNGEAKTAEDGRTAMRTTTRKMRRSLSRSTFAIREQPIDLR